MPADADIHQARKFFPRGLAQPEHGYRFSMDPLLLAAFAGAQKGRGLDLGCGCGVAGLAVMLGQIETGVRMKAVDVDPDMVAAARENAERLGFADRFEAVRGDVLDFPGSDILPESFDFAVCNPPFRDPGSGRVSQGAKARARFESTAATLDFAKAAFFALKNRARLYMVHLAERFGELCVVLEQVRLAPKRVRFVHSREDEDARIVLVEALKNGKPGLAVEPGLALYRGHGQATELTEAALAFCSFLECNPGPGKNPNVRTTMGRSKTMEREELLKKLAPCGLNCGKCLAFGGGPIQEHAQGLIDHLGDNFEGYAKRFEAMNPVFEAYPDFKDLLDFMAEGSCTGCRESGCLFQACKVKDCVRAEGVDFCYECGEFPCEDTGFPPNLEARWQANNEMMKSMGPDAYFEKIKDKPRYP